MSKFLLFCGALVNPYSFYASALDNDKMTGPSKMYKELIIGHSSTTKDPSQLIRFVNNSWETVLVLYSDKCLHCQEIKPQQEKAASKVLLEYPREKHRAKLEKDLGLNYTHAGVKFARMDIYRELHWKLEKELTEKYPGYETIREFGSPQAYIFRPFHGGITEIPHSNLAWGEDGYKSLRKFLRENLNGGQGYVWKKKQKTKVLGADWREEEQKIDKEKGHKYEL